jgi:hypothetical protein
VLHIRTARRVADILWPDFVERDGVILLATERPSGSPPGPHATLTEYERFHGHTHIQDVFRWDVPYRHDAEMELDRPETESPQHAAAWEFAKRMGRMWIAKLCADFPAYRFRVYVSRLDDPIVHFHRVRTGEPLWIPDAEAAEQVAGGDLVVLDSAAHTHHEAAS